MKTSSHTQTLPESLNDGDLIRRFLQDDDEQAFAAIVVKYQSLVRGVCRRVIGCEADIDDAFQATFLSLARSPRSVRKATSLSSWLYTVAWRASIRLLKQRQRRSEVGLGLESETSSADALEQISSQQDMLVLDEELNRNLNAGSDSRGCTRHLLKLDCPRCTKDFTKA